jgi:secreted PhoX family phosphatase
MTTLDKGMKEITIVSKTDIVGSLTGHPEGICFDSNGNIVVVTDGSGSSSDFLRFSE